MADHNIPNGFIYAIHAVGTRRVKLGFSTDPKLRLCELQTGSPFPLALLAAHAADRSAERRLHNHFRDCHAFGEWFEFTSSQIAQIKAGQLLSILPFNLKFVLPFPSAGAWWDLCQGKSVRSLKLRWIDAGKRGVFVFPSLQDYHLRLLCGISSDEQRELLLDYCAGYLDEIALDQTRREQARLVAHRLGISLDSEAALRAA